jgi:tripartite-type tricarboxylate transporter receptor subunit TctC
VNSRREFLRSLGAAALLTGPAKPGRKAAPQAPCSGIEGETVRWLVPFPPGGGFDTYSRLIEPFYEQRTGAEIVVRNISGAGGAAAARSLMRARPDGRTLGLLSGPGLVTASLADEGIPDPSTDFTILGRIVRNRVVICAGRGSPFHTFEDVLTTAKERSIVFGVSEVGSTNLINIVLTSHLLGIEAEYIAGFPGSNSTVMAALRGEIDLVSHTYQSVLPAIEEGDLKPLLQISAERILPHSSLDGVPLLGGAGGVAAQRAATLGGDIDRARRDADAIISLLGAGILAAAPLGLEGGLHRCLESRLYQVLTDPAFAESAARANRSLDVARGGEALRDVRSAVMESRKFIPVVQAAFRKLRGEPDRL